MNLIRRQAATVFQTQIDLGFEMITPQENSLDAQLQDRRFPT
jgi:hypothetical protein